MGQMQRAALAGVILGAAAFEVPAVAADSVADFYRGKTLHVAIGASAAGGYDLVGRIVASRIGGHIPGNPSVVVDNMPAASGLVMVNYLYNSAPRDGTAIGLPTNATALEPRLKVLTRAGGSANFDISKFAWLGTAAQQPQVLFVWSAAGVSKAEDLRQKNIIMGALSVGSDSFVLPVVMNNVLGARMQIVPGYEGHGDMFVAIERGEVQGYSDSFAGLVGNKPDWIKNGLVHILIQFGRGRMSQLPDVPTAIELAPDAFDKDALRFYSYKYDIAYAFIAPPEVPVERVAALRAAFDETMKDPDYIAAAKTIDLPTNPLDGTAVTRIIDAIQATPQDVVDHMRQMMAPGPAN